MTSKATDKKLASKNFRYRESETGKFNGVTWSGTIEPILPIASDGCEITWLRVNGNTRAEMDLEAFRYADEVMRYAYMI